MPRACQALAKRSPAYYPIVTCGVSPAHCLGPLVQGFSVIKEEDYFREPRQRAWEEEGAIESAMVGMLVNRGGGHNWSVIVWRDTDEYEMKEQMNKIEERNAGAVLSARVPCPGHQAAIVTAGWQGGGGLWTGREKFKIDHTDFLGSFAEPY